MLKASLSTELTSARRRCGIQVCGGCAHVQCTCVVEALRCRFGRRLLRFEAYIHQQHPSHPNAGLRQTITGLGWRYEDQGDIEPAAGPPPGTPDTGLSARNAYSVLETNRRLAEAVRAEAERGRFVLTLGGDHSVALGSIAGACLVSPSPLLPAHAAFSPTARRSPASWSGHVCAVGGRPR